MGRDCTGTRIGILVLERALCNDLRNGRTRIPARWVTGAGLFQLQGLQNGKWAAALQEPPRQATEADVSAVTWLIGTTHGPAHQIVDLDRCRLLSSQGCGVSGLALLCVTGEYWGEIALFMGAGTPAEIAR
jgi:hypothetical protein